MCVLSFLSSNIKENSSITFLVFYFYFISKRVGRMSDASGETKVAFKPRKKIIRTKRRSSGSSSDEEEASVLHTRQDLNVEASKEKRSSKMAFARIKRRRDENPAEALLLATKRLKTTDDSVATSVFKFSATLDCDEDGIISYLDKVRKLDAIKTNFKKPSSQSIPKDFLKEHQTALKNSRLEVINCFRALEDDEKPVTIVDIVSNHGKNADDESWVYDIYQQENCEDVDDMLLERVCSVFAIDFDENKDDEASDEYFDCSDDSNDENNWRNEYPDEEDDSSNQSSDIDAEERSINEEEMAQVMEGMCINDYELSSEDNYDDDSESDHSNSAYSDLPPSDNEYEPSH